MSDEPQLTFRKRDLVLSLSRLLIRVHPKEAVEAWTAGMDMLLRLDEETAYETLGHLRNWNDGDKLIAAAVQRWSLDPERTYVEFPCEDCGRSVFWLDEYSYMVRDAVWFNAGDPAGMLCIGCLELRLGRRLHALDFDWSTQMNSDPDKRSRRLRSRMNSARP